MSNEAETMEKSTRMLTPKRRFPEFRSSGKWKSDLIADVATISKGKGISKADVTKDGATPCIRYAELYTLYGEVINEVRSHTNISPEDLVLSRAEDVILPASGETRADIATAACVMRDGVALGGDLNILRSDLHGPFFSYLLNSPLRYIIAQVAQGDTVTHLYPSQISTISIAYPSLAEQQKIAECLSSLDVVIAAEGRKLEALRDHKRGLMQRLFPQPGQSQPRLRFPEFRDKGEWEESNLGSMTTKVGSGITPRGGDKNYRNDGRVFVRSQNVGWGVLILDDVVYIEEETHSSFDATEIKENDVLFNITGASIGRSAVADFRLTGGNVNQHVCIIRTRPNRLHPFLLNQYLISEYGQNQINSFQAGGNRQGLNFKQIRSFMIPMPPTKAEQDRIADCLTSLDTQITAQAIKIESLKQHKRGLMQQLFPAPEEQ